LFPLVGCKFIAHYPHVAIIGGGIGGVALAVACLHRGIDSSFLVAVIIPKKPKSLETQLKEAINNEDYELAKIINYKIKNK
jgi:thioredoxin reductase